MAMDASVEKYIYLFVGLVVLFSIVASLLPTAVAAGNDLNQSGAPLGNFFVEGGVIWVLIMAGLVIYAVKKGFSSK